MAFSLLLFYVVCLLSVTGDKTDNLNKDAPVCLHGPGTSRKIPARCPAEDPSCPEHFEETVNIISSQNIYSDSVNGDHELPTEHVTDNPPSDKPEDVFSVIIRVFQVTAVLHMGILAFWLAIVYIFHAFRICNL